MEKVATQRRSTRKLKQASQDRAMGQGDLAFAGGYRSVVRQSVMRGSIDKAGLPPLLDEDQQVHARHQSLLGRQPGGLDQREQQDQRGPVYQNFAPTAQLLE